MEMSSKIREGGEIRGVSGVDRSVVDSSSKRTRVLSEGERDETRNARREREKENTLRSDQKPVIHFSYRTIYDPHSEA